MDASFWQSILDADGAVPEGYTVAELTPELLALLDSTDAFLRDEVAFEVLAAWIARDRRYSPPEMRALGDTLASNLGAGLGEQDTDSVFLRSFSALVLDKVIEADNWQPCLEEADIRRWMEQGLAYVAAEQDLRGWVPGKGWAHALAHTADLLWVLAQNRYLGASDVERIFSAIAAKVTAPTRYVYLALEDERLAWAVWAGLRRDLLDIAFLQAWLGQIVSPFQAQRRSDIMTNPLSSNAYHNARVFLHSLYFQLALGARPPAWYADTSFFAGAPALREQLLPLVVKALRSLDPSFYAQEGL
jgi:hypothetical protein